MYYKQIEVINKQLKNTDKAIIALGCSFVQGQGAVNDELYTDYKWDYKGLGYPLELSVDSKEQKEILKKYPSVEKGHDGKLDFTFMEYDNAFVSVLCNKYFGGEYVPINLGIRGCGNRATIKELYFRPEIDWDRIKEIIVVYCPSGLERFDFVNDEWNDHFHWKCMWPHYQNMEPSDRQKLWEGYGKTVWSEKQGVIEQIANVQELMSWCKNKNAKLIITPSFDKRYTRKSFQEYLKMKMDRNMEGTVLSTGSSLFLDKAHSHLLDMFPWDNVFKPQGYETFIDLVLAQEKDVNKKDHFFQFLDKGSPDHWVTPCSHPSAKAHDLFAQELYNHIKGLK